MAAGTGILESARCLPMRTIASRWLGTDIVSESNAFSCESCAWNLGCVLDRLTGCHRVARDGLQGNAPYVAPRAFRSDGGG